MSWLSGFTYRKELQVFGSADGVLTDYPVKLHVYKGNGFDSGSTLYCRTHCNDDFSDLRFTTSNGSTKLSYWIDSYTAGVDAYIWVKLDSVGVAPAVTRFYVYYGDPAAISESNGDDVFTFFDDFSVDLSKWNAPPAGWSIGGGRLQALLAGELSTDITDMENMCFEVKVTKTVDNQVRRLRVVDNGVGYNSLWIDWAGNTMQFLKTGEVSGGSVSQALVAGTTYKFALAKISSDWYFWVNDTLKKTNLAFIDLDTEALALSCEGDGETFFDDVILRKYTNNEPAPVYSSPEQTIETAIPWIADYYYRKKVRVDGSPDGVQTNFQKYLNVGKYIAMTVPLNLCNSVTGWVNESGVDAADRKEGYSSIYDSWSGGANMYWAGAAVNTLVTEDDGWFHLWFYISDITKLTSDLAVEITSSGTSDNSEYQWNVPAGSLVTGWNNLHLKMSEAGKIGTPNLSAINYFRVYGTTSAAVTIKVDDLWFGRYQGTTWSISCDGNCLDGFDDIRFAASDGVTPLEYWIERKVDGAYAELWVKVPTIPASPDSTEIYLYYGYAAATPGSSVNAMSWAESFDGGFDKIWNEVLGTWERQVGSGYYQDNYREYSGTAGAKSSICAYDPTPNPIHVRWRVLFESDVNYGLKVFIQRDGGSGLYIQLYPGTNLVQLWNDLGGSPSAAHTIVANTWYRVDLLIYADGTVKVYVDDELEITSNTGGSSWNSFNLITETTKCKIDTMFIRKFTTNEPAVLGGTEYETSPVLYPPSIPSSVTFGTAVFSALLSADSIINSQSFGQAGLFVELIIGGWGEQEWRQDWYGIEDLAFLAAGMIKGDMIAFDGTNMVIIRPTDLGDQLSFDTITGMPYFRAPFREEEII